MPKKPTLNMTRPTKSRAATTPQSGKAQIVEGTTRLVVDMPTALHRRLKVKAVESGKTMREYVLEVLKMHGAI
jgi:hypothetical protein